MTDYMSSLEIIGWTERELARQVSKPRTTVRQWLAGTAAMPEDVSAWLEKVTRFHKETPPPPAATRLAGRPKSFSK